MATQAPLLHPDVTLWHRENLGNFIQCCIILAESPLNRFLWLGCGDFVRKAWLQVMGWGEAMCTALFIDVVAELFQ